jgi:hypothetical protein
VVTTCRTWLYYLSNSPNLFQNATGFEIVGGQFVLGDVHNYTDVGKNPHFRCCLSHVARQPAPGHAGISLPSSIDIMDDTFSESEVYCNQLLRRKRGFPLYVPGPQRNLPTEYQKTGVQIGDVGRVTPEGIFDFFFNIYLPADHPINDNDVPEIFYPLPHYASRDVFDLDYDRGSYVSTSSVRKLNLHPPLT